MEARHCLNCHKEITKKFCPNCGQKADTHRITFMNFITHDLLHGMWHLERGIFFTLKEAVRRPGQAALDYIKGKRIRYYNIFYLCLLLIAVNVILSHLYDKAIYGGVNQREDSGLVQLFTENLKFVILCIVPIFAIVSWILFRKLNLNLAEHFILGGISLLGTLVFTLPFMFVKFFEEYYVATMGILKMTLVLPLLFYPVWTYGNATKGLYKPLGFLWRIVLYMLLVFALIALIVMGILLYVVRESTFEVNL